ncbi:MAG: hypothetical protein IKT55_08435 [Clostridia bacterium]|nr:hypothetical protein [Clostridia bacterium]
MKKLISIIVICALLLSLGACSLSGNNTKFTIGVLDSVVVLDPLFADNSSEKIVASNCFEGLLRFDGEGKIDLAGATAYTTDKTALKYTFKLNPDAVWFVSDGAATLMESSGLTDFDARITADDYIHGIERFVLNSDDELLAIKGAFDYQNGKTEKIEGLKAVDDFTLEITLSKIDVDFLYKLASLPVYPCDKAFADALDSIFCSTPTTTLYNGPYYVKENTPAETILERNPDYSSNIQIGNKTITLYSTGNANTLISRFNEGNYDLVLTPDTEIVDDKKAVSSSPSSIWGIAFNCESEKGADVKIRKLLTSTIDYKKITLPEFALSEAKTIIPGIYGINDDVYASFETKNVTASAASKKPVDKLDEILKEMGADTLTVRFSVPSEMEKTAEAIVKSWQKTFGDKLTVDLDTFELKDLDELKDHSNYDLAILPITPEMHTATSVINELKDFPCYYTDKNISAKLKKPQATSEKAAEDFSAIEKSVAQNGVFVPLFYSGSSLYLGKNIEGMYVADGGNALYFYSGVLVEE